MRALPFGFLLALLTLGGCSYGFDVKAVMIDGRLAFVADGPSRGQAKCVSRVEVLPVGVSPSAGETMEAWRRRTYAWVDAGGYDCVDRFPVLYGRALRGADADRPPTWGDVEPKTPEVGVVYDVFITAGATGYGGGRFRLLPDGTVENLGPALLIGEDAAE